MSPTRTGHWTWRVRLHYSLVVLAAVGMFLGIPGGALPSVPVLAVVLALLVVNELMPVELPSGGYATASAVFFLPCLVVLGPFWTAALDVAATLLVQGLVLRRPAVRMLYNAANFAVTDFLAGLAFLALGGRVGSFDLVAHAGPLVVAGGVYFLVNSLLVSTIIGLTAGPDPWRVWERNFQHGILHHISFLALGVLATAAYFAVGPWALVLFAIPFGVARHSFRLYVEIRSDLKDFVRALSEVLEEVDPYTRHHSARVAEYAVRLARGLQLSERRVEEIEYAAFVHDIGKIGPQHQHILQKPGSLTHEEQRTLRTHPAAGAEIVQKVRALRRVSDIVRSHHERPDGLGYPFGLRASDVPVGARILNVADAFDAMTSDRPYRRALSLSEAIAELKRGSGTQFDAEVVSCLIRMHDAGQFPLLPSPSSEDLLQLRVHPLRARA